MPSLIKNRSLQTINGKVATLSRNASGGQLNHSGSKLKLTNRVTMVNGQLENIENLNFLSQDELM